VPLRRDAAFQDPVMAFSPLRGCVRQQLVDAVRDAVLQLRAQRIRKGDDACRAAHPQSPRTCPTPARPRNICNAVLQSSRAKGLGMSNVTDEDFIDGRISAPSSGNLAGPGFPSRDPDRPSPRSPACFALAFFIR